MTVAGSGDKWRWADRKGVQRLVHSDELRAALSSGALPPYTLVWRPGMNEWQPAYQVAELATVAISAQQGVIPNIPPPPLAMVAVQAAFERRADEPKTDVEPPPPPIHQYDGIAAAVPAHVMDESQRSAAVWCASPITRRAPMPRPLPRGRPPTSRFRSILRRYRSLASLSAPPSPSPLPAEPPPPPLSRLLTRLHLLHVAPPRRGAPCWLDRKCRPPHPPPRISRPAPTSMPPRGLSLLPALPSVRSNGASVESHYDSPSAFTSDAPPPNGASISNLPAFPFNQFAEDTPAPPHGGPAHAAPEMRQGSPVIYPSNPPVVPFEPSLGARLGPLLRGGWAFAKAHPKESQGARGGLRRVGRGRGGSSPPRDGRGSHR